MNCEEICAHIDTLPFADDPTAQRATILSHCETCASCRAAYEQAEQLEAQLHHLEEPLPSPMHHAVETGLKQKQEAPPKPLPINLHWLTLATVLMGCLFALGSQIQSLWEQPGKNMLQPIGFRLNEDVLNLLQADPSIWLILLAAGILTIGLLKPTFQTLE